LLKFQKNLTKYDLNRKEPQFTFLYELHQMHDDDLYKLSMEIEPRNAEVKDLI